MPVPAQALDPRYIPQQRLVGRLLVAGLAGASALGVLIVLAAADDLPGWGRVAVGLLWVVSIALATWHAERWPARAYAHTQYCLRADGLTIRRGVYWRASIHVPLSRVQHTDVSQGPLERRYGLGTLVIYTAGTDHARVALPGLTHDVALALRDQLRGHRFDDGV